MSENIVSLAAHRPLVSRSWHEMTLTERDVYMLGYSAGYDSGWKASDEDADAVHREAYRIVRHMAGMPERDPDADKAAAQRRADIFGQPFLKAGDPR